MTCYYPLGGWLSKVRSVTGRRQVVFRIADGLVDRPVSVPCGRCIGCKLERSRQWALRCKFEASLYDDNCFITLTYDDQHLPADYSVDVREWQLFMKRLKSKVRREFGNDRAKGIRFFHCGEYGETTLRPHYHAILFNWDFPDKVVFKHERDNYVYTSAMLSSLWPAGFSTIGSVSFSSAAYVARYCLKKLTGDRCDEYIRIHPVTGEVVKVRPEYATMSRSGGIGKGWFEKYVRDVYPHDYVVHEGRKMRAPRFFDQLFEDANSGEFSRIKAARQLAQKAAGDEYGSRRLRVRETVKKAQITQLKRGL